MTFATFSYGAESGLEKLCRKWAFASRAPVKQPQVITREDSYSTNRLEYPTLLMLLLTMIGDLRAEVAAMVTCLSEI